MAPRSRVAPSAAVRRASGRPPAPPRRSTLDRYLLDTEELVFAVRRHSAVLAGPVSIYLVVLAVAFLLLVFADRVSAVATTGLVVLLVGTAWFGWKVGDWYVERFTVTDRRVLLVSGLLTRRVAIMPLRKVTDLTFERSFAGRLLGYGAFVMESAGQQQALSRVDFLPRPESLYLQMSDLLFGRGGNDHDPDEDGDRPGDRPRRRPRGRVRETAAVPPVPPPPGRSDRATTAVPTVPPPPGRSTTGSGPRVTSWPPQVPNAPPAPPPRPPARPSAPPARPPASTEAPAATPTPTPGATTPLPRVTGARPLARRPRGRGDDDLADPRDPGGPGR